MTDIVYLEVCCRVTRQFSVVSHLGGGGRGGHSAGGRLCDGDRGEGGGGEGEGPVYCHGGA